MTPDTLRPDHHSRPYGPDCPETLEERVRRLEAANARLRAELVKALTCPVTKLPLRAAWIRRAERVVASGCPVALLLADLDDFKRVNDAYGHDTGDAVLAAQGGRLHSWCEGRGGFAGRLGGDEFAALVPDHPDLPAAVERLRARLREPVACSGVPAPLKVGASIGGVRLADVTAGDLGGALRAADAAMYRSKHRDRGRRRAAARERRGRRLVAVLALQRWPSIYGAA